MSNTNPRWPTRRVLASLLLAAFGVAALAGSALAASLVKNGSFEKDSNGDGIPNNWLGNFNFTPADKRVCNQSHAGTCSFRLVGDGNNKFLSQELAISGIDGDQYDLSAWVKTKAINFGAGSARGYVLFNHTGGGTNEVFIGISSQTSPWAFYKLVGAEATADYNSITIFMQSSITSGKWWVDQVKLAPSP